MPITDASLRRAIHNATGMKDAQIAADPVEYIHRMVEAGLAIIDVRQRMAGKEPQRKVSHE